MLKTYLTKLTNFILTQKLKHPKLTNKYVLITGTYLTGFVYAANTQTGQKLISSALSRTTGWLAQLTVPTSMRSYVYGRYAEKYGVNLEEAELELRQYTNFSEFFTRKIKPRQSTSTDLKNPKTICSPADAQILNISKITSNQNVIIKDITYKLSTFLFERTTMQDKTFFNQLKYNPQNDLYQIILYLCPGDYHRFHAPYKINVRSTREIKGELKPVNMQSLIKNGGVVYENNARKVLHCCYVDENNVKGYLGLVMVGALNVGDIVLNQRVLFGKGEEIGYFNLGSTIVMIVQAKPNMKWNKNIGEKVLFGEKLCQFE